MAKGLITASELANIKASGVYSRIVDDTRKPAIQPQGVVRLVAGFSKVGIFNRPVLFETGDTVGVTNIYGARDRSLERKGSWFHDTLLNTVGTGAVIGLNLLKTDDTLDDITGQPTVNADTAQHKSFSLASVDVNGDTITKLYSSYFNKERFWFQDEDFLLANRPTANNTKLFSLANTSQRTMSVVMKKASVKGFDVTVADWYSDSDVGIPKYLKKTDLISDYFVDIYVIAGDYSNYEALSLDPVMGTYFDKRGLIKDNLDEFVALNEVNVIRYFQGCVIPNFTDKDGVIKSIDKIINAGIDQHNIISAFDMSEYDKFEDGNNTSSLDMVGHTLINSPSPILDFMSYKREVDENFVYQLKNNNDWNGFQIVAGLTITSNVGGFVVSVNNTYPDFASLQTNLEDGDIVAGITTPAGVTAGVVYTEPVLYASQVLKTATTVTFTLTNQLKEQETGASGSFVNLIDAPAVAEILAVGNIEVTGAGGAGDEIKIYINNTNAVVELGSYLVQAGDTLANITTAIDGLINGGSHGYTSAVNGVTLDITSPIGTGDLANNDIFSIVVTGTVTGTVNSQMGVVTAGVTEVQAGLQFNFLNDTYTVDNTGVFYEAYENSTIFNDYKAGKLVDGDIIKLGGGDVYMKFTTSRDLTYFYEVLKIELFSDTALTVPVNATVGGTTYNSDGFLISGINDINVITSLNVFKQKFDVNIVDEKTVTISATYIDDVKIGQYLVGKDENGDKYLTRIISVKNIGTPTITDIQVETDGNIDVVSSLGGNKQVTRYLELDNIFDRLEVFSLDGITIKDSHAPNNTNTRVREIYSVMTDTAIKNALVDPDMISFRYLVDTFNKGLEPNSKSYLSQLVKMRSKAMAIVNTPTTKEFSASTNPSFKDAPTATNPVQPLKASYIADGGNTNMNPDFLYTLPTEEQGASYTVSFYPNINRREVDSSILSVPPAGYVSNNYVSKWRNGNGFKATAGSNRGVLSVDGFTGLDHMLTKPERGELESKGINPLRIKNGVLLIYGNQTNYHKFKSILNQANSRDTLITIETDTEDILDSFVFDNAFQDDIVRTTIINNLDNYYTGLRDTFGAIVSYSLKFDRDNNPDWVIEDGTSIIDVEIVLPNVTRKFINRITLTGNSATIGSFSAV